MFKRMNDLANEAIAEVNKLIAEVKEGADGAASLAAIEDPGVALLKGEDFNLKMDELVNLAVDLWMYNHQFSGKGGFLPF